MAIDVKSERDEYMVSAVVRQVARKAIADVLKAHPPERRDYPDIGEQDWRRVDAEVERYGDQFSGQREKYESAYRFLAERARGEAS